MSLNFLAHLDRGVSIDILREMGNYRFASNHGFDPFQRSQMETLGFANSGVRNSRIIRRARCSRVFTADLVSFMDYDLGYFDLETRVLEPLDNPFGPRLSPM